jgi:hypothetical protein
VIVGSAAGALIGLQFVVVTLLVAERPARRVAEAGAAFATPTIVHFGTALLLSAVLMVPWGSVFPAPRLFGASSLRRRCVRDDGGLPYARRQCTSQSSKTDRFTFCCLC